MRTSRELIDSWKNAVAGKVATAPTREREKMPGMKLRDERGRMVTIIAIGPTRIKYHREGYQGTCELSRREFERKFKEVDE